MSNIVSVQIRVREEKDWAGGCAGVRVVPALRGRRHHRGCVLWGNAGHWRPCTMKLRVSSANFTLEGGSLQIVENDGLVWLHYIYNTSYFHDLTSRIYNQSIVCMTCMWNVVVQCKVFCFTKILLWKSLFYTFILDPPSSVKFALLTRSFIVKNYIQPKHTLNACVW